MRLFFTTDIHGSERCFRKFVNAAKAYRADVLVLGGDVTGKLVVPIVEEAGGGFSAEVFGQRRVARDAAERDELEATIRQAGSYTVRLTRAEKDAIDADPDAVPRLFQRAIEETVERWMALAEERLAPLGVPVYVSPGNDDEPYLDAILAAATYVRCPENEVVELPDGREMISVGYANPTPFASPRELEEQQLEARVDALAAQLHDPRRAVFNLHCPPFGTSLDTAPLLDEELRPVFRGGSMVVAPAGSRATRAAIERHQPLVGLHGHIHESRAAQKLGRTLCLNPGSEYSEGVLRGVLLDLADGKLRSWQFTNG